MGETYYADNYEELTGFKPGEEPNTDGPEVLSTGAAGGAEAKVVKAPEKTGPATSTVAETK